MSNMPTQQCPVCRRWRYELGPDGRCDDCHREPEQPWLPGMTHGEIMERWNLSVRMEQTLLAALHRMPSSLEAHAAQATPLLDRGLVDGAHMKGNRYRIRLIEDSDGAAIAAALQRTRTRA